MWSEGLRRGAAPRQAGVAWASPDQVSGVTLLPPGTSSSLEIPLPQTHRILRHLGIYLKQETWVPSRGWEGPMEEAMATHSSLLAWAVPRREEPGGPQSMGSQRLTIQQCDLVIEQQH